MDDIEHERRTAAYERTWWHATAWAGLVAGVAWGLAIIGWP